jgi:putative flavoprotein involved in K+ transport
MRAERVRVGVVGGGQAGLAVSRELTDRGVQHVVLERGRVGQSWRDRWDSFCLVTPNWSVQLPGQAYDGDDPDGFMPRDEIATYLERYAAGFDAPVRDGVDVASVEPRASGGFELRTSSGTLHADAVVIATGTYRRPHRPAAAETLPTDMHQLDAEGYRSEAALPPGDVLIVGSGQTGCQIAEELHAAGRRVVLACGRAPWLPRRWGGRDLVWWAVETGFIDAPVESLPGPEARLWANLLTTGRDGGRDLNLRVLRDAGVTLAGHFLGAEDGWARFAPDLAESVAWGDERYRLFCGLVDTLVRERGLDDPGLEEPPPFDGRGPERLDLRRVGVVLFTAGFRPDYRSWVAPPQAFDELGFPLQSDGESTVVPGLFFLGVHFLRTRKSSLLIGVGEDAAIVARRIAETA